MSPSLVYIDLGFNRVLTIRTFVNINGNLKRNIEIDNNGGKTLKFNPIKRIILSNDDLKSIYEDVDIKQKLSQILFELGEKELDSLRDPNCGEILITSPNWKLQLISSWDQINELRELLNTEFNPWGEINLITQGNISKRVIPNTLTMILIEKI